MKSKAKSKIMVLTFLSVGIALLGCGGGGGGDSGSGAGDGGGGNGGGGGTTQSTETYLAYSGSFVLVDPQNLNNKITVSNANISPLNWLNLMAVNSYDPQSRSYSDLHRYETFFIESNQSPVYGVSLVKGSQQPQKRQISNIDNACSFIKAHYDYVNKKAYLEARNFTDPKDITHAVIRMIKWRL